VRLIAVVGAAPGVGKSTACARLAAELRAEGRRVDHFDEAEILTRPVFAPVAAAFRETGVVAPEALLVSTVSFVRGAAAAGFDVVVADALMPFVPSLLAFGHSEHRIRDIVGDLAVRLSDVPTRVVFLDGDAAAALEWAAAREGPDWLPSYGAKLARYGLVPDPPHPADLHAYLAREREVTLRVLAATGWEVEVVPSSAG
jgi:hypothetical protein